MAVNTSFYERTAFMDPVSKGLLVLGLVGFVLAFVFTQAFATLGAVLVGLGLAMMFLRAAFAPRGRRSFSLLVLSRVNNVKLKDLLDKATDVLTQILHLEEPPEFAVRVSGRKREMSFEDCLLDDALPRVDISLIGVEGSRTSLFVLDSQDNRDGALLSFDTDGPNPVSEVLVAALAAAGAKVLNAQLGDPGHHWLPKDQYSADELVERLRLTEAPKDFQDAIHRVHRRFCVGKER